MVGRTIVVQAQNSLGSCHFLPKKRGPGSVIHNLLCEKLFRKPSYLLNIGVTSDFLVIGIS